MSHNRIWLAFANIKMCRHADAIHSLGFISWRMGKDSSLEYVVCLFMSDERYVRFKMGLQRKTVNVKLKTFGKKLLLTI